MHSCNYNYSRPARPRQSLTLHNCDHNYNYNYNSRGTRHCVAKSPWPSLFWNQFSEVVTPFQTGNLIWCLGLPPGPLLPNLKKWKCFYFWPLKKPTKKWNFPPKNKKWQEIETIKNAQKKEQMSNMIKMRNVGAQTQKKWRPGGPPLEGREAEGWSPEEWRPEGVWGPEGWGPDLEKVRAPRVGVRRVGARRVGRRSVGVRRVGARRRGGPKFRAFFSLSAL